MYLELDELLSQETTVDSWYDDGFIIAQSIMNDFISDDWKKLSENVLTKDIEWQKKLVYCLDNMRIQEELELLIKLFSIENDELKEMCIDSFRAFDNELGHSYMKDHPEIINSVKNKINYSKNITKKIFESFLNIFDVA